MINYSSNSYHFQITPDEQLLYSHWQECVQRELPNKLIDRFRQLFILGSNYPNSRVWQSLERIVLAQSAKTRFPFILNRCCHILVNQWLMKPQYKNAILQLIALFDGNSEQPTLSRTVRRIRSLTQLFTQTRQFHALQDLAELICQRIKPSKTENRPLRTCISRYPYLYSHFLLTRESTDQQRQSIRLMETQVQQQFEMDLSRYLTYRKLHREKKVVKNPTLLNKRQLDISIHIFTGKVDGCNTHRDLAERFRTSSIWTPCYGSFKEDLYEYLTAAVPRDYGNRHFNEQLYKQLQNTLAEKDNQPLNEHLFQKTCKKLMDFLVVESVANPNHYVFSDLIANLGTTRTVGLLLKIVLLYPKIKPGLERKFALLFKHYESFAKDKVWWLIKSLENLNIALSTNFGHTRSFV